MWKILNWLAGPSKKQAAVDTELRENNAQSPLTEKSQPEQSDSANGWTQDLVTKLEDLRQQGLRSNYMEEAINPNILRRNSVLQSSGMAYWRKNTRQEQPADALNYNHLTSPGYSWKDPFNEDSANARKQELGLNSELYNLSGFLVDANKHNLSRAFQQRNQSHIQMPMDDQFDALPDVTAPRVPYSSAPRYQNYPHYKGDLHPEQPDYAQLENFAAVNVEANQASNSTEAMPEINVVFEDPALITDQPEATAMEATSNEHHEQPGLIQAILPDELVQSLSSVESSPECDRLFEESAASQLEIEAKSQRATLDRLPYADFVDVRIAVADHPDTSQDVLRTLAHDVNADVRFAIAENHNLDIKMLETLAEDENPYVAHRARRTIQRIEGGQLKQGNFSPRSSVVRRQSAN